MNDKYDSDNQDDNQEKSYDYRNDVNQDYPGLNSTPNKILRLVITLMFISLVGAGYYLWSLQEHAPTKETDLEQIQHAENNGHQDALAGPPLAEKSSTSLNFQPNEETVDGSANENTEQPIYSERLTGSLSDNEPGFLNSVDNLNSDSAIVSETLIDGENALNPVAATEILVEEANKPVEQATKPANKPAEQAAKPANKPAEQAAKPANKPAEQAAKPANKPAEQAAKPANKPAEQAAKPANKPAEQAAKPANKPAEQAAKPANKPAEQAAKPANKPAEQAAKPANKPAEQAAKPANKPAEQAAKPANKPAEQAAKPANKPAEQAAKPVSDKALQQEEAKNAEEISSQWVINVSSTTDPKESEKNLTMLKDQKIAKNIYTYSANIDNKTYYRIRLGSYKSKAEAEKAAKELTEKYKFSSTPWVVRPSEEEVKFFLR